MLTRLYIDNYRCFVNFEFKPAALQLILGGNGTGKSSFMDALGFLRDFVVEGTTLDDVYPLTQRTRWLTQSRQKFELEVKLGDDRYRYQLVLEMQENPLVARVALETVDLNGLSLLEFVDGQAHLRDPKSEAYSGYELDWHRSALSTLAFQRNPALLKLKNWLRELRCFRINPFQMESSSDGEARIPLPNLSNIAAWYRHLVQSSPREATAFLDSLTGAIDNLSQLRFQPIGERASLLEAEFRGIGRFSLNELSDGQRCLIALYMILHFVVAKGGTVVIDEPENFISLREIQPWLTSARDAAEDAQGQVLLISHHPEIINQWAPENGVLFVRDTAGSVRVEEFRGAPESALTASESIARGWERE